MVAPQRLLPVAPGQFDAHIDQPQIGRVDVVLGTRCGTLRLRGSINWQPLVAMVLAVRVR
jgi:hypothetical protein